MQTETGNQQATDLEIGWLAGIIDGEGWLGFSITQEGKVRRPSGYTRGLHVKPELKITNCDEAIIERAAAILHHLGVNAYRRSHKQLSSDRRIVHECAIKNMAGLRKILPVLEPHLTGNKQQRARLILRFIELRQVNPGHPNPNYSKVGPLRPGKPGRLGPGRIKPFTAEELHLIELCRDLQGRGASETTRESRDRAVKALIELHARARET